jgi:hypothetical protein
VRHKSAGLKARSIVALAIVAQHNASPEQDGYSSSENALNRMAAELDPLEFAQTAARLCKEFCIPVDR